MNRNSVSSKQPEIPEVPQEVINAAQQGKLVVFIGAGVSRLVGGPSWNELADKLLKQITEKRYLSFDQLDLLNNLDSKKKISIAMDVCEAKGFKPDFRKILHPNKLSRNKKKIYQYLYSIGTAFVTTNYDEWLDQEAEQLRPVPSEIGDITSDSQKEETLIKLSSRVFFRKNDLTIEN